MAAEVKCRCCGVPVAGARQRFCVCIGCDRCDGLHGAQLQGVLALAVRDGKVAPWTAIARALIDDAQLTGRTRYVVKEGETAADIDIPDPPPRWLVVAARSLCRNELPDVQSIVDQVLAAYIPGRVTSSRMASLRADLRDALHWIDPEIMDVEVATDRDALDPHHLRIMIKARTPVLGVALAGEDAPEIPADIMSRPRAEA